MSAFQVYRSGPFHSGKWRWRLKAENGRIVASASQGFSTKQAARANADLTRTMLETSYARGEIG